MTEIAATAAQRLMNYQGEDRVVTSSSMRHELKTSKPNPVRFSSGYSYLDQAIDGFEGGELIALSGPTKNGKTLLAQSLTMNFMKQQIFSLWISFEIPIRQFLQQIPAECEMFIPRMLVPHRPTWLEDRILESKLKFNNRVVFIDHLHYLVDLERSGRNISIDIGAVVRGLKRQAVKHNIVIFLLCHATKGQGALGEQRELGAMDIRDSSFVGQEADSTWIIRRVKEGEKEMNEVVDGAVLKVCNHRRTGKMDQLIYLKKSGQLLIQQGPKFQSDQPALINIKPLNGGDGYDSITY